MAAGGAGSWPELPWHEWADTLTTLHLWTQVMGRVKLAAVPRPEQPWLVALTVTDVGLTTSLVPYDNRVFAVDLDFADHQLRLSEATGGSFEMDLEPMTVAHFYRQLTDGLAGLGFEMKVSTKPYEVADPIPFDQDEVHAGYEREHVFAFHAALQHAHRALEEYQRGFSGISSPVAFYWGSFDVSTSRFTTERASDRSDVIESACGWWPTDQRVGPAFYAYTKPAPTGFKQAEVRPAAARWDDTLGEFVLPYDDVRGAADPAAEVEAFLASTRRAGQPGTAA
jgi:hypothetical protein